MSDKPARENQKQHAAFLAYSEMPEPSAQKLWESWVKVTPLVKHKKPSISTLEYWRKRYNWVARSEAIHQAAKEEAVKKAVSQLTMSKEEILAITRAVMIRYGQQLRSDTQKITALDFEKAWRIQRIELGLPTEIGKHQVDVNDRYKGVSDEELLTQLEGLTAKYREKISNEE